jgi:hypothetical protein
MALPDGRTCEDCRQIRHCAALGYSWPERERCDFSPIRFHDVAGSRERTV